jgi:hypothetical protein
LRWGTGLWAGSPRFEAKRLKGSIAQDSAGEKENLATRPLPAGSPGLAELSIKTSANVAPEGNAR